MIVASFFEIFKLFNYKNIVKKLYNKCNNEFDFEEIFQKEKEEKLNQDEYGKKCNIEGIIICSNPKCNHSEEGCYSYYDEDGSGKMSDTEIFEFNDFEIV